jgi:RimJ/RimL family protein N-acetyltransferase
VPILPLRTERLLLRVMKPADAATLAAYRGDPAVARFQDWELPFTLEDAERALAGQADLDDLQVDAWVQIAIEHDGVVVGDLAVNLARGGHVPFVGYTLAPEHQGHGYASEAAAAIVEAIFTHTAAHRIVATLDPQNFASMRVIEPLGFEHEGVAREHELIRGEWVDDSRFALLRKNWEPWRTRDRSPVGAVELREITPDNERAVFRLRTFTFQEQMVAPMAASFADALIPEVVDGAPVVPWYRAIYAGEVPVGFLMIAEVTAAHPEPYLWRLLIDRHHQGRGFGRAALLTLGDRLRAAGRRTLLTSWVDVPGGPAPFYRGLGFVPTGEMDGTEVVARLEL